MNPQKAPMTRTVTTLLSGKSQFVSFYQISNHEDKDNRVDNDTFKGYIAVEKYLLKLQFRKSKYIYSLELRQRYSCGAPQYERLSHY